MDNEDHGGADADPHWVGLGSAIAKVTRLVGIEPCEACRRRQQSLDRLVPRVFKRKGAPQNKWGAAPTKRS